MEITSVIFVHNVPNKARAELATRSLDSLIQTTRKLPCELIVINNGSNLLPIGGVTHYIRNANNLHFGYARNQGLKLSSGEYIAITDNDIIFEQGWLEECLSILKNRGERKLFATPLPVDKAHRTRKYAREPFLLNGVEHIVNCFSGSNCWVMKREDFEAIGYFRHHRIAGTKWAQQYERIGYAVASTLKPMAQDKGLKGTEYAGYSKAVSVKMEKHFTDGSIIDINEE